MLITNLKKAFFAMFLVTLTFACSKKSKDIDENDVALGTEVDSAPAPISEAGMLDATTPDRVFFAYDSAALVSEAKQAIKEQSSYIKNNKIQEFAIEGHCDERGTSEYNMALGHKRAESVKSELVKNGVNGKLINVVSFGKSKPAVDGDNEIAYQQNRRAVVVIKK